MWVRVTPTLAEQLEAERELYAVRPSNAEVVTQLVTEGLAFRRMHRSPLKPKKSKPKRIPFPIDMSDWPDV